MKTFFAILVFLFSGASSALLGAKECTYGPSYWCDNLKNAKQCGAVKHCIKTEWEHKVLPEDNGGICTICKDMVKQARDQLESKENQELLKQVFEGACRLIPIQEIQKECITYSDEYIPELIETLASQMNPQIVCATVGLCNSAKIDRLLAQQNHRFDHIKLEKHNEAENDCGDCKRFIDDVKTTVRNTPKTEVLHSLLEICGRLDTLSDGCKAVVEMNFPVIYDFILHQLDSEQACELVGFCPRIYGQKLARLPHNSEDQVCEFCEAIVQHWRDTLNSNTTKEEFREIVSSLCDKTGKFSNECNSLVSQYFDLIYNLLMSEVQPQQICQVIGLCGPNSVFMTDLPTWTLFNIKPADHIANIPRLSDVIGQDEANSNKIEQAHDNNEIEVKPMGKNGVIQRAPKKEQDSEKCMICEFVLHFIQDFLQEKHTREEVKEALDNVCKHLPRTINEQCQDYVDAYGDQIIQLVILEIDPSTLCPMLHMCPQPNPTALGSAHNKGSSSCTTCEFVMTFIDEMLKKNTMSFENALKEVCNVFPDSVTAECDKFVDRYGLLIIEYLENDVSPKNVCTYIGLCTAPKVQRIGTTKLLMKQSNVCILCEFILKELDRLLELPATVQKVERAFEKVCAILPSSLANDCISFVEAYSKNVIDLLVNRMKPATICTEIRLCHNTLPKGMPIFAVQMPADECVVCEYVMDAIHKHGKNTNIESLVSSVCSSLQKDTQQMCEQIVRGAAYAANPLMKELGSAKASCQAMDKCPLQKHVKLLGSEKCTWGPAYWCQSEWHAASCGHGATRHCVERVWAKEKKLN